MKNRGLILTQMHNLPFCQKKKMRRDQRVDAALKLKQTIVELSGFFSGPRCHKFCTTSPKRANASQIKINQLFLSQD